MEFTASSLTRHAAEWVSSAFQNQGITIENSDLSASEIYLNFLRLIANGAVELLDTKRLLARLRGLERRSHTGGKDLIDHFAGSIVFNIQLSSIIKSNFLQVKKQICRQNE